MFPARSPNDVYEFVVKPENLPRWAPGLCLSVTHTAAGWQVQTAQGVMRFRFAGRNSFGVLDHYVTPAQGAEIYVTMRAMRSWLSRICCA